MSVDLHWTVEEEFTNKRDGTVTRIAVTAAERTQVTAGFVPYFVDELPVVFMGGAIPAYRDLGEGSRGVDVTQVQYFLTSVGAFSSTVDGVWNGSTTRALRAWQAQSGLPRQDTLPLGSVWFVPTLPLTVSWNADLAVGVELKRGVPVASILADIPTAELVLPNDFARLLESTSVDIVVADETVSWTGTADIRSNDDGQQVATLALESAGCGGWCASVPTDGIMTLPATVTFAGPVSGTIVPVGALTSVGDDVSVIAENGQRLPVSIEIQVAGEAVVTGISPGDTIVMP